MCFSEFGEVALLMSSQNGIFTAFHDLEHRRAARRGGSVLLFGLRISRDSSAMGAAAGISGMARTAR